jgi:hypothetical protein
LIEIGQATDEILISKGLGLKRGRSRAKGEKGDKEKLGLFHRRKGGGNPEGMIRKLDLFSFSSPWKERINYCGDGKKRWRGRQQG